MRKILWLICFLVGASQWPLPTYAQNQYQDPENTVSDSFFEAEAAPVPLREDTTSEEVRTSRFAFPFKKKENWPSYQRKISDDYWNKTTADKAFQYTEAPKQKKIEPQSDWFARFINFLMGDAGQVILWTMLALALIVIVYQVIKNKGLGLWQRAEKPQKEAEVDESADGFIPEDWDKSIKAALAQGNYRLAIRLSFRWALAKMAERELIQMQPSKTNYQYAFELKEPNTRKAFMEVLHHYEYAWYGGFPVDAHLYQQFENRYKTLQHAL